MSSLGPLSKFYVVIRLKDGRSNTIFETNNFSEAKAYLYEFYSYFMHNKFVLMDREARNWYVNRDEVREVRIEDPAGSVTFGD